MDSPLNFIKWFGRLLKKDLTALFKDFHDKTLPLFHLNYGIIMLLPKQKEATNIKKFGPICLLNVSFKIFTKVAVRGLIEVIS
jgi:hypothetical protein